jgi:GNAT superfamily N-acetyltransferase
MAVIRRARPEEAEILSALAVDSEAYWGYAPEYMERFKTIYRVTVGFIKENPVYVLLESGQVQGFYGLLLGNGEPALEYFYIAREKIGRGFGTLLWKHLVEKCRELGIRELVIIAAPEAAGFYKRMGAVAAGELESRVLAGRKVIRLVYTPSPPSYF